MKKGEGIKLLVGLIVVFALFQWVASALGSTRGEAGVLVGLVVVTAILLVDRLLLDDSFVEAFKAVGLGRPKTIGVVVAILISIAMLLTVPLFAWQTDSTIEMYPNWNLLGIGLFFQAGIAEETLFRGYLFRHLRQQHTFAKGVFFAAIPFVLVHLILFLSLPWSLAGASILLSIAMSFPLSKLFELGGDSMWPPAIVHFAAQAVAKLFFPTGDNAWLFPFFVILASAIVPQFVFFVPLVERRIGFAKVPPLTTASKLED